MLGRAFTEAEDVKDGPAVAVISEGSLANAVRRRPDM